MLVQRGQFAKKPTWFSAPSEEPKVAILLNANAHQVNERVIRSLAHTVSEEDLFLSRSEMDTRRIVQQVAEGRYDTIFCGGGDGTFVSFINEIFNYRQRHEHLQRWAPKFGVLKLGTGNGLAAFLRASPARGDGFVDDVLRARSGQVPRYRCLDLLVVEKWRTPFAGLGTDARVLNDYVWFKSKLGDGILRRALSGSPGYFSAAALKTIPHVLTHSITADCEVINGASGPAYRLGPDGVQVGEPIAPGEVLFRGRTMITAAGTIPFYGFEFRIFPFAARRPGMMHLRLGAVSTSSILANLPKLWNGRWFPAGLHDFHVKEVAIRFDRPLPLQIGGDAAGYRDQIDLKMAPETVEMVDFGRLVH